MNTGSFYYGEYSAFQTFFNDTSVNGAMAEVGWYDGGFTSNWLQTVQMVSQLQSCNYSLVVGDWINTGSANQSQVLLYGYCSLLLATQNNNNYLGVLAEANSNPQPPSSTVLQLMQSLNALNLGSSLDSYSEISGTQVYTRDFQNVKVLVNPSSSTYSVSLTGQYTTLSGSIVSGSYSVAPYTGVVLIKG